MTPTPRRLPKLLRTLLRLGLFVLGLAALFSGLRLWLDAKGRAILAKYPQSRTAPVHPVMPGSRKDGAIAFTQAPFLAAELRGEKAPTDAASALYAALSAIRHHGTTLDFVALLKQLGLPVSPGMTQAEAATAFLDHARSFDSFLAEIFDAARGPAWDFSALMDLPPAERERALHACELKVCHACLFLDCLMQAHWRTGNGAAAWENWQTLTAFGEHFNQPEAGGFAYGYNLARQIAFESVRPGLALNGWRDQDLQPVSDTLGTCDLIEEFRQGVEAARDAYARRMALFIRDRQALASAFPRELGPDPDTVTEWRSRLESFTVANLVSDTQIAANAALADHRLQLYENQWNYRDRSYVPMSAEDAADLAASRKALEEAAAERSLMKSGEHHGAPLIYSYWFIADGQPSVSDTDPTLQTDPASQNAIDQTRLALALEAHRRSTGTYPDSLDAVAPFFPGGPPHDVATGQPFFYQKSPDGTYKLWGTGLDQTDHGGDPKKDVLFKLPKPQ